jgi:hypothetical protein
MSNLLAVLAVATPAAPRLSALEPRLNHLAQQGPRQEAFAVGLVENFVRLWDNEFVVLSRSSN